MAVPDIRSRRVVRKEFEFDVDRDGQLVQAAGAYARHAVLTAFEMIGGVEAMAEWALANKSEFYTKLFPKLIGRAAPPPPPRALEDEIKELVIEEEEIEDGDQ